jgi:hypothetical protein
LLIPTTLQLSPVPDGQFCPFRPVYFAGCPQEGLRKHLHRVVSEELIVEDDKLGNMLAEFLNILEGLFIFCLPVLVQFEESQIVEAPDIEDKTEFVSDTGLHINQFPLFYFFVDDFVIDRLDFERVHFVHFGGDQHGDDPDDVKLGNGESLVLGFEVAVHDVDAGKVGF